MKLTGVFIAFACLAGASSATSAFGQQLALPTPDIHYVPTSGGVAEAMLKLAKTTSSDIVFDLGSGDGRIVIAAAKKFGARGVGVELDADLIRDATKNAQKAGVAGRVSFRQGDLFKADLSDATVVTLYLSNSINMRLRDLLQRALKPGSRIVSHRFTMGDWKPDAEQRLEGTSIYLWTIPPR
jgi:cyclopropane fatty-acyl-phospholipid synthase-like methyltransferase